MWGVLFRRLLAHATGAALLVLVAAACSTAAEPGGGHVMATEELKTRIDAGEDFLLIDVRTAFERKRGYIPGSTHMPLDELRARTASLPKDKDIVVYCYSGSRSAQAVKYLMKNGFTRVWDYSASWRGWTAKGYPTKRDE
ncbi:MAG: rhodanese-like domain-containing protein [Deltaproteobacteria bacterium]|nr:rhodanese-like domain-containing protein [Deltaproteobacteria bacterium]